MKALVICATALVSIASCKKENATPAAGAPAAANAPAAAVPSKPGAAPAAPAAPSAAPAAPNSGAVVARYLNKTLTLSDVDQKLGKELYDLRRNGIEKVILKELVGLEAKKAGQDEQTFMRAIADKAGTISDDEAKKIYDEKKAMMQGKSFEEMKPVIQQQMGQQKQRKVVGEYLENLKKGAGVKIMLAEPRVQVSAEGPAKGPATAPITIVEFSDFECPFCTRGKKAMDEVMAAYPGKVRLVFRDFPLPFHKKAQKASEAAHCANEQGKFWELHDKMFDAQDKLDVPQLKEAAKALGLDAAKFDTCLDSNKHAQTVKKNLSDGQTAGVNGTPAFFINGRLLSGALPFEKFKEVIDEELAKR